MITQARLKEILRYDPSTGVFTWRVSRGSVSAGSVTGCVNSRGYKVIRIHGKNYQAHRLAFLYMDGRLPPHEVDHINQVKLDNRWLNLRPATCSENMKNATKRTDNTSGFTGVCRDESRGQWQVRAKIDGKQRHLGYFDCLLDAVAARIRFNRENGYHSNHGAEKGVV